MQSVKEIGTQLTFHDRDGNFYNITPALSPSGDKIAYLSDKSGYADIMLISAIDGTVIKKLVSGEKTPNLEELHWLSPGMSWSPDSKKIVFSAKASDNDAILIVDVLTGGIEQYSWKDLEGVFGGSWSPDGRKIVFSGIYHGQSDVYVFDLDKKEKYKLTNDIFSDTRAVFSRDGKKIAFVSDRREYLSQPDKSFKMVTYDYKQSDIYIMNADGSGMERITTDEMNDTWPEWGPDNSKMLYTSNRNGVTNIYVADLTAKRTYAITNNLSGIFQPSLSKDGKVLAYSGFNKGGFDVFTLKNPFDMKPLELPMTISMKKFRKEKDLPQTLSDELGFRSSGMKQTASKDTVVDVMYSASDTAVSADTTKDQAKPYLTGISFLPAWMKAKKIKKTKKKKRKKKSQRSLRCRRRCTKMTRAITVSATTAYVSRRIFFTEQPDSIRSPVLSAQRRWRSAISWEITACYSAPVYFLISRTAASTALIIISRGERITGSRPFIPPILSQRILQMKPACLDKLFRVIRTGWRTVSSVTAITALPFPHRGLSTNSTVLMWT